MIDTPRAATVVAQAKVNLRLRVLEREPSGYHQLETLFLRLALGDTVRVRVKERRPGDAGASAPRTLTCAGPAMPPGGLGPPEQNLAWRAAAAYADACGWPAGFDIAIDKQVPVGGGLGGGSADAAAVLRALDALAPAPLGSARLMEIAARLGSDVPFLASEAAFAIGRGRGERLAPLDAPPGRPVLLVIPPFGVNTAEAYGWVASARAAGTLPTNRDAELAPAALGNWDSLARLAANDFEPVVAERHPGISTAVQALRDAGARLALMSGSGSTVFGIFDALPPLPLALPPSFRVVQTRTATHASPVVPTDD